jgi:hypothetical protein
MHITDQRVEVNRQIKKVQQQKLRQKNEERRQQQA